MVQNIPAGTTIEQEREWLAQAQLGNADAFCELCRVYETRLLRQAFILCGDESTATELAQDALVQAWKSIAKFRSKSQLFTWLSAILLNCFRNHLRSRKSCPSTPLREPDDDDREHLTDLSTLPDQSLQAAESAAYLRDCIARLTEKHREVIHLRFYLDDSLEAIAEVLGCSIGTVKSRLFHALENLRIMNAMKGLAEEMRERRL